MTLIKCKECNAEISNKAKTCPQCGVPVKKVEPSKTVLVIAFIIFITIVIGVTKHSASSINVDDLTLAYLNREVYANPVECRAKKIGNYEIASCQAVSLNGKSIRGLWLIQNGKYLAINGTSMLLVDTKLKDISNISSHPLPLPKDMDVPTILKAFE